MSLKDGLILQTEQAIDKLRERRSHIEPELAQIDKEIKEARELLHLLKTGNATINVNGTGPSRKLLTYEEVQLLLEDMPEQFGGQELAEALDSTISTTRSWAKRLVKDGFLIEKVPGRPRYPAIYRKVS